MELRKCLIIIMKIPFSFSILRGARSARRLFLDIIRAELHTFHCRYRPVGIGVDALRRLLVGLALETLLLIG